MSQIPGDLTHIFGQQGFAPNSVEPTNDFEVIPPGEYPVIIDKADGRPTKNGNGFGVNLEMSILDGQYKYRKLFMFINLSSHSQKAEEIGQKEFSALGRAIGLSAITNTNQIVQQTVIAHVKVKENQNRIRTFSSIAQQAPGYQPPQQAQPQSTQQASVQQAPAQQQTKPPWMQNGADCKPQQPNDEIPF